MNRSRIPLLGALGWHGRLAIAGILTTIVFMAAIAMVAFTLYQRVALDLVIERDERLVYLSASRVREELAKFAANLDTVARDPEMYGMVPTEQARLLRAEAPDLTVFDGGVVVLDSHGRVRTTVPDRPDLKGEDWSTMNFFRSHLTTTGMAVSNAFPGGPQGSEAVVVSVPIVNDEREFVGVLAGMFKLGSSTLSPLYSSIVRLRIGQSGSTYVVDGSDRILYDSGLGEVGVPIASRGPVGMVSGDTPRAWRTHDADGHDIVAASAGIPGTPWTLVSEEDADALAEGVLGYRRLLYTLMTLGIALPAAGVALMVHRGWTGRDPMDGSAWQTSPVLSPVLPRIGGWRIEAESNVGQHGAESVDFMVEPSGGLVVIMAAVGGRRASPDLLANVRAALRMAALQEIEPAAVVRLSGRAIGPLLTGDEEVRSLFARLDPVTGAVAYARSGYPAPSGHVEAPSSEESDEGRPDSGLVTVSPGASLVLGGPGVALLANEAGESFGAARLEAARAAGATADDGVSDCIVEALCQFAGRKSLERHTWSFVVLARAPEGLAESAGVAN